MSESTTPPHKRPIGRIIGFWGGLALFLVILLFVDLDPENPLISRMAAVAVLMAVWWIADAIPLAATSLLPLVLFPALGILKGKDTAPIYVNYIIFLFLGGFLIALAMERWNLHKRIALFIVRFVGSGPSRLVLGFMLATAFLSMWISNTATSIMMLAIGLAVIRSEEDRFGKENTANLSVALLLGIAYSASVGGMATLVGTPPNLSFARIFELTFPGAEKAGFEITFGEWLLFGLPLMVILLAVIWLFLTKVFYRTPDSLKLSSDVIQEERRKLGKMSFEEIVVSVVFFLTAMLWVSSSPIEIGSIRIPGWTEKVPHGDLLDDGTIAIAMALVLFLIPTRSKKESEGYATVLDFGVFPKVPWHIILLFGGGFALAKGFQSSGLSAWVGDLFAGLEGADTLVLVGGVCSLLTFLTELTSNTATTELMLPLLASIAIAAKIQPLLLMIPATLSASCAFMMPVATPPNAIVFGSGHIRIGQMVKIGIVINLIGILVITLMFYFLGPAVFGFDAGEMPDWAVPAPKPEAAG